MNNQEFKPFVPADKVTPELTVTSIIIGVLLAVIFGAANAYLGLRAGMTVSASIPAAVISMAVIRVLLKKDSILENNMVQTIGSAGEAVAAGAIFTLPALYLWAREGILNTPSIMTITVVAIIGGLLGVLFMVPLRNALIVKEHGFLPYPEAQACAEVLRAGEKDAVGSKSVFAGMGIAVLFKFITDGIKIASDTVTIPFKSLKTELSINANPSLLGVGYICGLRISSYMFTGGIIGWLVLIPAIIFFGGDSVLFPATVSVSELYLSGGASAIWDNYIRYIGAGALASAGIISLIKTLPTILTTFKDAIKGLKNSTIDDNIRTNQNINMKVICIITGVFILIIWLTPFIPLNLLGAIIVVLFGFFFATVSSRMVGLVGDSNNSISGMTIATLICATTLLKITGNTGAGGMESAIIIGSLVCIIAATAGDTSQDLKTGFLLGATPKKQQIGEIIGALCSALAVGGILNLLDRAWGFGSEVIPAPQATLMKIIIEGVMDGNLPWTMVIIGTFLSIATEILGIPSLPVAIGIYLPFSTSATIMIGGLAKWVTDKINSKNSVDDVNDKENNSGILFCSGMIAGEGLLGILLAVFAVIGIDQFVDISEYFTAGWIGTIIIILLLVFFIVRYSVKRLKDMML